EFLLGYKRPEMLKYQPGGSALHARLQKRLGERSLIDHFYDFLETRGVTIPAPLRGRDLGLPNVPDPAIQDALLLLYRTQPDVSVDRRDHLQLDGDVRREAADLDGGAGRPDACEVLGVDPVVDREVLHIGQVDGHVDDPVPGRPGVLQHRADVPERGAALQLDVMGQDGTARVARHPRDLGRAARARADAGKKKQISG